MADAIEIEDLSFAYFPNQPILENISVSIKQGEYIAIFGPNGGGKTTFLKLLMGFLKPTSGKLSLFGQSPKDARKVIGYVPQSSDFDLLFPISVEELVLMGSLSKLNWLGRYPKEVHQKAKEVLSQVRLLDKIKQPFGTLSGGQKQRALIARALIDEPEILFLDEPTSGVDAQAEEEIYQFLSELKGKMTILMVTHDLQAMLKDVERLLCIHRKVTSYKPDQVCAHFAAGLYHKPLITEENGDESSQ